MVHQGIVRGTDTGGTVRYKLKMFIVPLFLPNRVLSGEFQVVNQHLLRDLTELNLWNDDIKNAIIAANGSIQNIDVR